MRETLFNNNSGFAVGLKIFVGSENSAANNPGLASNSASATANGYAVELFQAYSTGDRSPNFHWAAVSPVISCVAVLVLMTTLVALVLTVPEYKVLFAKSTPPVTYFAPQTMFDPVCDFTPPPTAYGNIGVPASSIVAT